MFVVVDIYTCSGIYLGIKLFVGLHLFSVGLAWICAGLSGWTKVLG